MLIDLRNTLMLYVCPTPIGNMGDITGRVLETLAAVDLVAAEDTRHTGRLLKYHAIDKPLLSFFEHNELRRVPEIIGLLQAGKKIALVSDAGMPGICDPGYRLVSAAIEAGIDVTVLPGPSALDTALVASGYPTDSFVFLGYVPRRKAERLRMLETVAAEQRTCIVYEAPHRLAATLEAAADVIGDRSVAVCRELTKKFEEVRRGTAAELAALLPDKVKGEIVVVFDAAPRSADDQVPDPELSEAVRELLGAGLSPKRAADIISRLTGTARNRAYRLALELGKEAGG